LPDKRVRRGSKMEQDRHWLDPNEPRWRLDTRAFALSLSRNGRTPPARREMIEYLISRTMGNQRRHTASLLAVQSPPAVRLSVCLSVCLSYMQPVGIQGRRAPPVHSALSRFASTLASSSSSSPLRSKRSLVQIKSSR